MKLAASRHRRPLRTQQGFTLLEILAAFVIFALVFAGVLQALSGSLRNTVRSADYTQATLWAQSKLDMVGIDPPLEEGRDSGRFDDKFSWEIDIQAHMLDDSDIVDPEQIGVDLFKVELIVFWGEQPRQRRAVFTTLRSALASQ